MSDSSSKSIENIQVGDQVASFDRNGDRVTGTVTRLFRNSTRGFWELENGVLVTGGHRFLTDDNEFREISVILKRGLSVVDVEGNPKKISARFIGVDTESFLAGGVFESGGNLAFKSTESYPTYNFEVDTYHTYIAGGFRVHNDSYQVDRILHQQMLSNGVAYQIGVKDGAIVRSYFLDKNLDGVFDYATHVMNRGGVFITTKYLMGPDGRPIGRVDHTVSYGNRIIKLGDIGSALGSTIGAAIVGEDQFAKIAAGSVLAAVLQNVGQSIDTFFTHGGRAVMGDANVSLIDSVKFAFNDFGKELFSQVKAQGVGAISGFLAAELGEAIGVGGGFGGQLFNTVASKSIGHIVTTAAGNIAAGAPVFQGLLSDAFLGNLASSVGGFIGGYLGREIVTAKTQAGAIGGSIGSALGATIGTSIASSILSATGAGIATAFGLALNFALPGIGAFIGVILGTLLGDLFGGERKKPKANADATLYFADGHFYAGYSDRKHDGNIEFARAMNERARTLINGYIDLVGGLNSNSVSPIVRTGHKDENVYAQIWNQDTGVWETKYGTADEVVEWATFKALKLVDIQGGDIYIKRAVASSQATNLRDFVGDLKIAEDYRTYLENKSTIDAIIAADPKSVFAAGWIVTLVRAEELGITTWQKSDFNGGLKGFLHSMGLETLGGAYEMTRIRLGDDRLLIDIRDAQGRVLRSIEVDEAVSRLGFSFVTSGTGSVGRDVWLAPAAGGSFTDAVGTLRLEGSDDILIGGNGADTINAGIGWDYVQGGGGNDTINAGAGNDQAYGGDGDDTIYGDNAADSAQVIWSNGQPWIIINGTYFHIQGLDVNQAGADVLGGAGRTWFGVDAPVPTVPADGYGSIRTPFGDDELHGGAGNDTIEGLGGSDRIYGDAGNDILRGGSGDDRLEGGDGADTLDGGIGLDTASYAGASAGVTVNLLTGTSSDGDTLTNIEDIVGSKFADTLIGNDGANIFDGGDGADAIDGNGGTDTVSYRTAKAGVVIDLVGGAGTITTKNPTAGQPDIVTVDTLTEIEGAIGSDFDDTIIGNASSGKLVGGKGNDTFKIQGDGVTGPLMEIIGGDGLDTLDFSGRTTGVTVDLNYGDTGNKYYSIEKVIGGDGNDTIKTYEESQVIEGGKGDDILRGNAGDDIYVFKRGDGNDTIQDFGRSWGGGYGNLRNDSWVATSRSYVDDGGNDILSFGEGIDFRHIVGQLATETTAVGLSSALGDGGTVYGTNPAFSNADFILGVKSETTLYQSDTSGLQDQVHVRLGGDLASTSYRLRQGSRTHSWTTFENNDGTHVYTTHYNTYNYGLDYQIDANAGAIEWLTFDKSGGIELKDVRRFVTGTAGADAALASASTTSGSTTTVHSSWIFAGAGADTVNGGAKNDIILGDKDNDILNGAAGDDQYAYWLGDGNDVIFDSAGDDALVFGGGIASTDVRLVLGALATVTDPSTFAADPNGADLKIEIYDKNGLLSGSVIIRGYLTAANKIEEFRFSDTIKSLAELTSTLTGTDFADTITGSAGNETINGLDGNDKIVAGDGDDILIGGKGGDDLDGGIGKDFVSYATALAAVTINMTTASDLAANPNGLGGTGDHKGDKYRNIEGVIGSDFNDSITGDVYANELRGGAGNDAIYGGDGDDVIIGGLGTDTLRGNAGIDTLSYEDYDVSLQLTISGTGLSVAKYMTTPGTFVNLGDNVAEFERFRGGKQADTITGDAAANHIEGGAGADTINGLGGLDTVSYETSAKGVLVDLAVTTAQAATFGSEANGDAAGDILTNIENLTGSTKNDALYGTTGNNVILGGAGDDLLVGRGGTDTLDGGNGVDTAEFAGAVTDYDIIQRGNKIEVHKKTDAAAILTTLTNIEKLKFGSTVVDATVDLPQGGSATIMSRVDGAVSGKFAQSAAGNMVFSLDSAAPVNGTFTLNANGTYSYTPSGGFTGTETIRVRVTNALGVSSILDVTLKAVPTNLVGTAETLVNTSTGDWQYEAAVASLNDGGYFVTWTAGNSRNGYDHVMGQRFDAQGNKVGTQVFIDAMSNIHRRTPAMASLIDGGFVVTWYMQPRGGSALSIYARRYDAQGQPVGAEFLVSPTTGFVRSNARAIGLADGGFIIAWEANGEDGGGFGLYAQRYSAAGVAVGTQFLLNSTTAGDQRDLTIAQLGDGSLLFVWSSNGQDGSGFGIYARRFGADGVALGGEVLINVATAGNQTNPSITRLADGSLIVAWSSDTGTNIYARRLLADGTPTGSEFQLNANHSAANVQSEVEVKALPDGGFVAVWRSDVQDGSLGGVYARIFTADGTPATEEFRVNTTTANSQELPSVTILSDGRIAFIWQSPDGSGFGVYSRIFQLNAQTLEGGALNDVLQGGLSNDTFIGGAGADKFLGELGTDTVSYKTALTGVKVGLDAPPSAGATDDAPERTGDAAGDILESIENLEGSKFNDVLVGNAGANILTGLEGSDILRGLGGNDRLVGGAGNDVLEGGAGADILIGSEGDDTASYATSSAAVSVDLLAGTVSGGDAQGDTLTTIENLEGSAHDDTLGGNDDANVLLGKDGNDLIQGRGGEDILSGGAGNDDLQGGSGNDTLYGDEGDDLLNGGVGSDIIDGGAGRDRVSYASSGAGVTVALASLSDINLPGTAQGGDAAGDTLRGIEDIEGSNFADTLTGNELDNRLFGRDGNDTLTGGSGDDTIRGDAGADTLDGGIGNDWLDYSTSAAGVSVNLATNTVSGGDAQGDVISNFENLTGSAADDTLTGSDADNRIEGGLGADLIDGGSGNDTIAGGGGADTLDGGIGVDWVDYRASAAGVTVDLTAHTASGGDAQGDVLSNFENIRGSAQADTLTGSTGDNEIDGGAGNDIIRGEAGNDTIAGGAGADDLDGGDGLDWLDYSGSVEAVTVSLAGGTGSGGDAQGDVIQNFENIRGTAAADTVVGSAGSNILEGKAGDDTLEGGAGEDWLYGGIGLDTASYQSSAVGVTVDLSLAAGAAQISLGDASGDRLHDIENVTGSAFDDTLIGSNRVVDSTGLVLSSGNNTLKGGAGADTISGGSGDDKLHGDEGADTLSGDDGDDILIGGSGADILTGGAGSDTVDYSSSALGVTVSLLAGTGTSGDADGDQLSGIENLTGSAFADTLTGDGLANMLNGGAGDDVLDGGLGDDVLIGGSGADQLIGGDGTDTASYQTATSAVTVNLGNVSLNTGDAQGDTYTGIEILRGSSFNDTLTGSTGDETIIGGAGADTLNGGDGNDTLSYVTSLQGVSVNLKTKTTSGGDAQGDVISNFENVSGSAGNDVLIGDDLANRLLGNAGNDGLSGGAGADILLGGDGDDILIGGADGDTLDGGSGVDTLDYAGSTAGVTIDLLSNTATGGHATGDVISGFENITGSAHNDNLTGDGGNNKLVGGAGNDNLLGDAGNDDLSGGTGNDTLTGGAGNDVYRFAKGDGADTIVESGLLADSDQLVFASDVKSDDLWFRQDGNNLVISVLGTDDSVTVQNWFSGTGNVIEEIRAGDGKVLDHSEVQLLINAMSSFQPSSAAHPFGIKADDSLPQQVATVYASTWQMSA
jgi:Ca2+-binding RTX toxin-like protein